MTGDANERGADACDGCPSASSTGSDGLDARGGLDGLDALAGADGLRAFAGDDRAEMERRDVAKLLATIGGLTAVGSLVAPVAGLTRVFEREFAGPVYADGTPLVDARGNRITENSLQVGGRTTVFPETHPGVDAAPTLLVRFRETDYGDETRLEYTVAGYAAYSKVCTHAGCMVSEAEDSTLVCPCHFGKFDPLAGARVVGGPPPRALPQLPITMSAEGYLIATGNFEGPVGPGEG